MVISMNLSEKLYRCALDSKCVLMTFIGAGIGEVCIFDKEKRHKMYDFISTLEYDLLELPKPDLTLFL